jgi:hypothetical protein
MIKYDEIKTFEQKMVVGKLWCIYNLIVENKMFLELVFTLIQEVT